MPFTKLTLIYNATKPQTLGIITGQSHNDCCSICEFITNTNVTLSFNTLNSDGWHLVGNPYNFEIDLKKFINLNINNGNLDNLASGRLWMGC